MKIPSAGSSGASAGYGVSGAGVVDLVVLAALTVLSTDADAAVLFLSVLLEGSSSIVALPVAQSRFPSVFAVFRAVDAFAATTSPAA